MFLKYKTNGEKGHYVERVFWIDLFKLGRPCLHALNIILSYNILKTLPKNH